MAALRVLFAILGLGAVAWLVMDTGPEALWAVVEPALVWLPLATAFELARVAMDAVSSRATLGRRGSEVPWLPLLGSHLVAFAVMGVAPAGRATAEAVKASLLARWIGGGAAVALGAANQANVLLSSGTFTLLSAAAAWSVTGWSVLTWALLAHSVSMNVFGLALRAGTRWSRLTSWVGARSSRLARHIDGFVDTSHETSLYPLTPVSAMVVGRGLQAAHFFVLAAAVGLDPSIMTALALHGVYLVIAAIGVFVPGQLGASEGGFTYSAEILGTTEARALAIALLAHAVQFAIVGVGFIILATWPGRRAPPEPAPAAGTAAPAEPA